MMVRLYVSSLCLNLVTLVKYVSLVILVRLIR